MNPASSSPFKNHAAFYPVHPADLLLSLSQDGRLLEDYVEEFLELSHLVPWNDDTLKSVFWSG